MTAPTGDRSDDRTGVRGDDRAETRRDPWLRVFYVVIIVGIVAGLGLGFREVADRPVVEVGKERVARDGLTARVQVLARNTSSSTAYCVEIRITVLDREGLDLQDEVVAEPTRGEGRLRPGQTVNFVAVFDDLDEQDWTEELDEFVAYVAEAEPC